MAGLKQIRRSSFSAAVPSRPILFHQSFVLFENGQIQLLPASDALPPFPAIADDADDEDDGDADDQETSPFIAARCSDSGSGCHVLTTVTRSTIYQTVLDCSSLTCRSSEIGSFEDTILCAFVSDSFVVVATEKGVTCLTAPRTALPLPPGADVDDVTEGCDFVYFLEGEGERGSDWSVDWNGSDLFVTARGVQGGMSGEVRRVESGEVVGCLRESGVDTADKLTNRR